MFFGTGSHVCSYVVALFVRFPQYIGGHSVFHYFLKLMFVWNMWPSDIEEKHERAAAVLSDEKEGYRSQK